MKFPGGPGIFSYFMVIHITYVHIFGINVKFFVEDLVLHLLV